MLSSYLAGSIVALNIASTLAAGVQFAGINIAGFDFGCVTDGTCPTSRVYPPVPSVPQSGGDGPGQMKHFTTNDKFNIFRLPVAWQFLVNNQLGGTLDATNLGQYDKLVQACLTTGAHCIIDIHNYARWNGGIIGAAGGPTNDDFSGLWKQLATKYAADSRVVMGLMNEPHDMPSISDWAGSVQAAVTAIRGAGATSQMILLPGDVYTSAAKFVAGGSAAALAAVTNPDGSTHNLIFDVHQYLDSDSSGTHPVCIKNGISDAFQPLVTYLQSSNRQALVSEIGGGNSDPSCLQYICEALDFMSQNSKNILGWVAWAAGSFAPDYVYSLSPRGDTDVPLVTQCFAGKFEGGIGLGSATGTVGSVTTGSNTAGSDTTSSYAGSSSTTASSSTPGTGSSSSSSPSTTSGSTTQPQPQPQPQRVQPIPINGNPTNSTGTAVSGGWQYNGQHSQSQSPCKPNYAAGNVATSKNRRSNPGKIRLDYEAEQ